MLYNVVNGVNISRSDIEIEAKALFPDLDSNRLRRMAIDIQSWCFGRGLEGKGLEAIGETTGQLDSQEIAVVRSLARIYPQAIKTRERIKEEREEAFCR